MDWLRCRLHGRDDEPSSETPAIDQNEVLGKPGDVSIDVDVHQHARRPKVHMCP